MDRPTQDQPRGNAGYNTQINRRHFFKVLGSGLAVTFTISSSVVEALGPIAKDDEDQISAWIHVGEDNVVTVYTGKAEVGQNIRTSLAQIVAEELEVELNRIVMVMGDTSLTPYDRGTFGSRSIPYMGPQLRMAAASAREYLIDMAADKWKCDRTSLRLEKGLVIDAKQKSIAIGQLAAGKKLLKAINKNAKIKPVEEWKISGTPVLKVGGESFITGRHKYVSDMTLPDMLHGKVLRAPSYGATLIDVDLNAAKKIPGVIVLRDGEFVGVAAPTRRKATDAISAMKPRWKLSEQASRKEIFTYLKEKAEKPDDRNNQATGNVSQALLQAHHKIEKSFNIDYIAHAPLEPRAGVAQWIGDKLTVWTGTQRPFGVQEDLESMFHIPKEQIRVITPDTGSGYGGKHTGEAGIEAARLSKAAGKPVKIVWTREEEFTWAYLRPAGVIEIRAGVNQEGILQAWEFHNYNSGGSGIETSYEVANKLIQYHPSDSPLPQGSYRGLAATANVFARESIMNDLAQAVGMDPLAFRLKNLKEKRMKDVLEAAAAKFGWNGEKPAPNHGVGIACGEEKGSYIATCAEVSVSKESGQVKVVRVVAAFECGAIINPNHLEHQIMGSVIQGMGGALFERIEFENGKITNSRFSAYRLPRFSDCPKLDVVMLNRKDIPSLGAGETPILAIAPAIRNAIENATGKKLYTLPLVPDGLKID
ncbi:MAG: molybdopterin cofactor-binding domain-containing protein [Chryseolinea sp.]